MATKFLVIAAILCLALCVGIAMDTGDVYAQGKSIAQQEGLGNKEFDQDKLPGKLEIAAGIGSIFVMIAVLKYA